MSVFDEGRTVGSAEGEQFKFTAPGVALEGSFVELSNDVDGEFGTYRFLSVKREDGTVAKIIASGFLKEKLVLANLSEGDQVGVRFNGLKKSKAGREYKDWTVAVKKTSVFN